MFIFKGCLFNLFYVAVALWTCYLSHTMFKVATNRRVTKNGPSFHWGPYYIILHCYYFSQVLIKISIDWIWSKRSCRFVIHINLRLNRDYDWFFRRGIGSINSVLAMRDMTFCSQLSKFPFTKGTLNSFIRCLWNLSNKLIN